MLSRCSDPLLVCVLVFFEVLSAGCNKNDSAENLPMQKVVLHQCTVTLMTDQVRIDHPKRVHNTNLAQGVVMYELKFSRRSDRSDDEQRLDPGEQLQVGPYRIHVKLQLGKYLYLDWYEQDQLLTTMKAHADGTDSPNRRPRSIGLETSLVRKGLSTINNRVVVHCDAKPKA